MNLLILYVVFIFSVMSGPSQTHSESLVQSINVSWPSGEFIP